MTIDKKDKELFKSSENDVPVINDISDKIFKAIDNIKLNNMINNAERSNLFVEIKKTHLDRFVSDGKTSTNFINSINLLIDSKDFSNGSVSLSRMIL